MGNNNDKYKKTSDENDSDMELEYKYRRNSRKRRDKSSRNERSVSKSRQDYYRNTSEDKNSMYYSTSEFHCKVCNVYSSGLVSWQQHICGKRHAYEMERQDKHLMQEEMYQDNFKKRKRLKRRQTNRIPNNKMNKKRKLAEETDEEKNFVGLDYVLVIHKQGKSVFQCFLCDTCTMYQNSKQLTDHVLGDKHQRAYVEQHDKGLIKIKRLKSKNPGKGAMKEYIEQMLLNPNRKDKFETRSLDYWGDRSSPPVPGYLSSCDKKSTKTNHRSTAIKKRIPNMFLRRTIEQVEIHNRRYASKITSSTFVPERKSSSSSTPNSVTLKNLSPPCQNFSSPIRSPSISSNNSTIFLSDDEVNDPVASTKTAIPSISELKEILTTNDIFNLVLLKMENIQLSTKEEFDLLNEVVEQSTKLSKEFKQHFNSTVEENIQLSKKQVDLLNEVVEQIKKLSNGFKKDLNSTMQESLPDGNSASLADMDQNSSVIVPDSFGLYFQGARDQSSHSDLSKEKDNIDEYSISN